MKKDLSYKASIEQENMQAFHQPAFFRISKKGDPLAIRFIQHGKKLKRIEVCTQRVLMNSLSHGFVRMAAEYAAKRGWRRINIVQDEYRGYQLEDKLTFVNMDQMLNVVSSKAWFHRRPIFDRSSIEHYLK